MTTVAALTKVGRADNLATLTTGVQEYTAISKTAFGRGVQERAFP